MEEQNSVIATSSLVWLRDLVMGVPWLAWDWLVHRSFPVVLLNAPYGKCHQCAPHVAAPEPS